jgi:uncharacterized heparinase superfamily protein
MSIADTLRHARLFLDTTRHLNPAQVVARARRMVRVRLQRLRGSRMRIEPGARFAVVVPLWNDAAAQASTSPARLRRARAVAEGRFDFLNDEVRYADPDWHDASVSQLWRYHLHYFELVEDLAVQAWLGERAAAFETFRRLVRSWLAANQRIEGDGWHPYTISLRCVNWCHAATVFATELATDPTFAAELAGSTFAQLRYLARNIEFDVRGNHIIENLRALVTGGIAFDGDEARRWIETALGLLRSEVAEQILPDGGHFERVPAYHVVVARDLLEIAVLLRNNRELPSWLEDAVARMLTFADFMIMADGHLPLLKDTTFDGLDPHELLAAGAIFFRDGRWKRSDDPGFTGRLFFGSEGVALFATLRENDAARVTEHRLQSEYVVIRPSESSSLILDVGRPCPDYLPAHAHADLFSFELCLEKKRVVVDSGVYLYESGPWRDSFRSTRAHNTVEVNGENQSEVWASFRVARRARPRFVQFTPWADGAVAQAEHDGYERLPEAVRHRRTLAMSGDAVVVIDQLFAKESASAISAASSIHLHPGYDREWVITTFGSDADDWSESWYSERFGEKQPNPVLVLSRKAVTPFAFGYVITRGNAGLEWDGNALHVHGPVELTVNTAPPSIS